VLQYLGGFKDTKVSSPDNTLRGIALMLAKSPIIETLFVEYINIAEIKHPNAKNSLKQQQIYQL
jgi:hypothetical protein